MRSRTQIITAGLMFLALIALLAIRSRYISSEASMAGADAADKLTSSWVTSHKLMVAYEQEQSKLRTAVITRRKLYQDGEISKAEVVEAERSFVDVLARIQEVRRAMMITEIAIAETELKDEALPAAVRSFDRGGQFEAPSGYGGGKWSLRQAQNIEKYFYQTFGHELPVSALGQTATHDRLRFDHREAMDVALHPDSPEGRALIGHLRRSGIPFIAFRGAAAGASTGAHIHIGRPSQRMAAN